MLKVDELVLAAVVEVKLLLALLALPTTKFVVEEKAFVRVWILMCRMTPHVLFGQSRNVPWGQRYIIAMLDFAWTT